MQRHREGKRIVNARAPQQHTSRDEIIFAAVTEICWRRQQKVSEEFSKIKILVTNNISTSLEDFGF